MTKARLVYLLVLAVMLASVLASVRHGFGHYGFSDGAG